MNHIVTIACKELKDGIRNRWVVSITLIFVCFSLGLAYFGAAASGSIGFVSLSTTIVSLSSLAIFIIPLIALLLAYDGIVGEEETGTLLLLLSYPISRTQLLLGKFFGHSFIVSLTNVLGFGIAALVIFFGATEMKFIDIIQTFGVFIFNAVLLSCAFIALAYLISACVQEKSTAAGIALIIWFIFVFIFDLSLLGILVATEGRVDANVFSYLLLLNPTDIFRILNVLNFTEQVNSGILSLAVGFNYNSILLYSSFLVWIILPLMSAIYLFNRKKV